MEKKVLWFILTVGTFAGSAPGLNFKQVAYIPSGLIWSTGYIKGTDINHDGYEDLVFTTVMAPGDSYRVAYYGYRPYNRYVFEDTIGHPFSAFWDIGDLDGDSLVDLVTQAGDSAGVGRIGIRVFEPQNYWSFPKIPVWSWRYEYIGNDVKPRYITDLDRDDFKEILTSDAQVIYVFENRGDNQYQKVFSDTIRTAVPSGSFAFGDFEGDGRMEFAIPTYGGPDTTVFVYKCTGDDQYQKVWGELLNTPNMYDCVTGPDLDGDGKPEFIIGSLRTGPPPWAGCLWVYEATGINQYNLIFSDSIVGVGNRGVYCVHSDCGDIDRDGRPELVWAIDRDWMVYKSPGNNQFQRVFSAYGDNGHNSTNIHIHDMNGNGYPEIIESGGNETHIWEVEACQVVYPNGGETLYCDTSYAISWRNVAPFVADSFSLFFSTDSSRTYSLIAHGIPGSDSSYVWTVPDTLSDTCFIMLWAYQNATGWDFSDSPFRIRPVNGVEVGSHVSPLTSHLPYRVAPNPFASFASVPGHERESFTLYDVSGRNIGVYKGDRIGAGLSAGIYFLKPEGNDSKPLRIVKLR
jgi:hypothetical protein